MMMVQVFQQLNMSVCLEPFVHLEGSRSSKTGGVGLGMAIARDSILRHGGQIHLSNRDGGGLRVTVLLPAVIAET